MTHISSWSKLISRKNKNWWAFNSKRPPNSGFQQQKDFIKKTTFKWLISSNKTQGNLHQWMTTRSSKTWKRMINFLRMTKIIDRDMLSNIIIAMTAQTINNSRFSSSIRRINNKLLQPMHQHRATILWCKSKI